MVTYTDKYTHMKCNVITMCILEARYRFSLVGPSMKWVNFTYFFLHNELMRRCIKFSVQEQETCLYSIKRTCIKQICTNLHFDIFSIKIGLVFASQIVASLNSFVLFAIPCERDWPGSFCCSQHWVTLKTIAQFVLLQPTLGLAHA